MKVNKILVLAVILLGFLFLHGCTCKLFEWPPEFPWEEGDNENGGGEIEKTPAQKIEADLVAEGIDVTSVQLAEGNAEIHYNQGEAETEEVYANWGFIFVTALKYLPGGSAIGGQTVKIFCTFEDGEIVTATTNAENILAFENGEKDTWEFLYDVEIGCATNCPISEE